MLESIRKHAAVIPHVSANALLSVGVLTSFAVLLSNDLIHPLVVYALQIYLAF
jgi:hypothetical protein